MSYKKIVFGDEAREKILKGAEIVYRAVGCTLGPKGKNVLIERHGEAPHLTKDGFSVSRAINLKDQFLNMGAQMIKEAASQTVESAGDGTTSSTILAFHIYQNGLKLIAAGHNSTELKKGIDYAVSVVVKQLESMAKPISGSSDIIHVGTVSANGDKTVGEMLAKAFSKVGRDGIITVEESKGYETELEVVEGMRFNRGFISPYFVSDSEKMTCELDEPYVLITNKKFEHVKDLLPVLEQIHKIQKPLLIIADDIEGEALHALSVNKMKGNLNVCAIRAPEFGAARFDALEDISILTGGQVVSDSTGIELSHINLLKDKEQTILGKCKKVIVGKNYCTLVGLSNKHEIVKKKAEEVKNRLTDPTLEKNDIEALQRRITRLSGGVAVIRVGGSTEVEMRERKDRIDDALCATTAAIQSGIVAGGGTALIRASRVLKDKKDKSKDFNAGIEIIRQACMAPISQIVRNVGDIMNSEALVINTILKSNDVNFGWNAATEEYGDLVEQGIIDPLKVPKTALINAASVAGLSLTIDAVIAEEDLSIYTQVENQ